MIDPDLALDVCLALATQTRNLDCILRALSDEDLENELLTPALVGVMHNLIETHRDAEKLLKVCQDYKERVSGSP